MLKNHLDEEYLKGFLPGLVAYLWPGEENYTKQKTKANQIVFNDLIGLRVNTKEVSPELILKETGNTVSATESSDGVEDLSNRLRWVIDNATVETAGAVLTLKGSNDNDTYYDIADITLQVGDTTDTVLIEDTYKYYKITTTVNAGTIDYRSYLVETKYDLLFAYKWIELILRDAKTQDQDQYNIKEIDFRNDYKELLNSGAYGLDTDGDGVVDTYENAQSIAMLK